MARKKRKLERAHRRLHVEFRKPGEARHVGFTSNVSAGGLFIATTRLYPPGTELQLEIKIDGETLSVEGMVAHAKKGLARATQNLLAAGMGIRFKEPQPALADRVELESPAADSAKPLEAPSRGAEDGGDSADGVGSDPEPDSERAASGGGDPPHGEDRDETAVGQLEREVAKLRVLLQERKSDRARLEDHAEKADEAKRRLGERVTELEREAAAAAERYDALEADSASKLAELVSRRQGDLKDEGKVRQELTAARERLQEVEEELELLRSRAASAVAANPADAGTKEDAFVQEAPSSSPRLGRTVAVLLLGAAVGFFLARALAPSAAPSRVGAEETSGVVEAPSAAIVEPGAGVPPAGQHAGTASADPREPSEEQAGSDTRSEPDATEPALPAGADPSRVHEAVAGWSKAWAEQRPDDYLAFYGDGFTPPSGLSRAAWVAQRRDRIRRPSSIELELGPVELIALDSERVRAVFDQSYRTPTYSDRSTKTLEWEWQGDRWRIVAESSG